VNTTGAPEPTPEAPGLEITGFTLFGGLQVYAAERDEATSTPAPAPDPAPPPEPEPAPAPEPA